MPVNGDLVFSPGAFPTVAHLLTVDSQTLPIVPGQPLFAVAGEVVRVRAAVGARAAVAGRSVYTLEHQTPRVGATLEERR